MLLICLQTFSILFITEEMNLSDNVSSYSSDSLDSIGMNWLDMTGLIAKINFEASSYNTKMEGDDDAVLIKPYEFEPSTELFSSFSEESDEDDKESDERLANTDQ